MSPARARLFAFAFVDELAPWLALFTLWLDDHGVGAGPLSTVFAAWATITLLAEVPSGALSDRMDRRRLLGFAVGLRALGMSVCLVWPTLAGALIGAGLWAVHGALASGTWEALVYEHLEATGAEADYPVVMARIGQANQAGTALAALAATGMVGLGISLAGVGWITVGLQALALGLALGLPAAVVVADHAPAPFSYRQWVSTLRSGLKAAAGRPALRRIVAVCALLEGLFVLDEYVPLLGRARGADDASVPLLVLAVWGGLLLGGELAARRPRLSREARGGLLALGALALAAALASEAPWSPALVGLTYIALNAAWIISEAELQAHAPADARATARSVAALGAGLLHLALFGVIGALAVGSDPSPGLWWVLPCLALTALLMTRWMPAAAGPTEAPVDD